MYTPKKQVPISVAYKRKSGSKVWVKKFEYLLSPDKIIANRSKYLPEGSEIIEIGVGVRFFNQYTTKYKK